MEARQTEANIQEVSQSLFSFLLFTRKAEPTLPSCVAPLSACALSSSLPAHPHRASFVGRRVEQGRAAMDACDAGAVECEGSTGSETTQCLDLGLGEKMRKNQCPSNRENTKIREWRKNAELCRMSCCAVAWRAGRERQTDSWRHRGGHSSRSDNAMRRMILGSGSRDSRWYQCAPPAPGAPGVSWPQAGPGLVTSSNRTDSAAVHRSTPACHDSMAASIPPNLHGKLSSFWTGNLEGDWRGAASFVVHFLAFFQRPGLLFQHCVSMHVIFCGGTSSIPRSPPKLYSAAGLAIVSLEMCWPASAEVWINSHHANQRTAVVAGGSGSGGNRL